LPPDLLDAVQEREYIKVAVRVWPDAKFNPPLFRNAFGALDGYEVDLAWAIADSLNVGLEMTESDPQRILNGNWQGEWDIALSWLPITDNAQQTLVFSLPYAYDRSGLVVHASNQTITSFDDLAGRRVGVPNHTLYYRVLTGQASSVQGQFISGALPPNLEVIPYNRDGNALLDLAQGDGVILDAVLHSMPPVRAALEANLPLKVSADNLLVVPVGIAFDRSGIPAERLRIEINNTLTAMHQNGTLAELSIKWYDTDISGLP
jgi:ABC-type amino acid transport substrate-binding protein